MITDNPFLIPSMPEQRKMELFRSIKMNLESPYVAGVHILNEAPNNQTSLHPSDKLRIYNLGWRSTFLDAIRYANAKLPPGTAFAVANADIVFAHESIRLVTRIKDPRVVITLSRHEVREDGTATLHADPALSQDVWIMRTPFPEDAGFDFPMGTLGSDNKLAYLYSDRLNMTLENWCSDVVTWHLHVSQIRSAKARIPQPYKAAPPKRANLSMLAYEWADAALLPMPRASFAREVFGRHGPRVLSLDIPRIADQGLQHSQLSVDKLAPEWTSSSVWELLAHAKKRRRVRLRLLTKKTTTTTTTTATNTTDRQSVFGGHDGLRSESSSSRQYLLDLPWSSLARERMLDANASLIRSLLENAPADFAFENACAIVPAEVLRPLCLGAPEWSRMTLGVVENGRFGGFVACPPREV